MREGRTDEGYRAARPLAIRPTIRPASRLPEGDATMGGAARFPALRDELRDHAGALGASLGYARTTAHAMADLLLAQYERWPRRYHDGRHLLASVRAAEALRGQIPDDVDAVAFALWFHDAVYKPWRSDNEARSATMARRAALRLRL